MSPTNQHILEYIQGYAKNKIILHRDSFVGVNQVNVGIMLSNKIYVNKNNNRLPLIANSAIEEIFNDNISINPNYGKCLFVSNIGILLETELKLDLVKILEKYSSNHPLFIQWDGEIEDGYLYFLSREKGIKININELSHITI
jgi:hypothetical protein